MMDARLETRLRLVGGMGMYFALAIDTRSGCVYCASARPCFAEWRDIFDQVVLLKFSSYRLRYLNYDKAIVAFDDIFDVWEGFLFVTGDEHFQNLIHDMALQGLRDG